MTNEQSRKKHYGNQNQKKEHDKFVIYLLFCII